MTFRQAKTAKGVIIWVDEKQEVGRYVVSPNGDEHYVIELLDVWTDGRSVCEKLLPPAPPKQTHQIVPAMELEVGDELEYCGAEIRITGLNKTQGTYYIYMDAVSLETGRKMPSQKVPKKTAVRIKSREDIKMLQTQNACGLAEHLLDELKNYLDIQQLPVDADGKVQLGSFKLAKDTIQKTALAELKATYNKLGENLKRI